ncbi:MAG TPA: hypothetical protein VLE96_02200 [Chlamydiales bacterium]|nr:hypothetical protein [Chlamydiales bacterium]
MTIVPFNQTKKNSDLPSTLALGVVALATAATATAVDAYARGSEPVWKLQTPAKLERSGCYLAGSILAVSGIMTDNLWGKAGCAIGTIASLFWASNKKDYQDNRELLAMNLEAQNLSFPEIVIEHGLENLGFLQTSILQQKFSQHFATQSFTEIIKSCPLATILRYQLADPQFIVEKFVQEVRRGKLPYLNQWQPNEDYEKFLSPQMHEGLRNIQQEYRRIPSLNQKEIEISKKYLQRAELLNQQHEDRKKRIPQLAEKHVRETAGIEQKKAEIQQQHSNEIQRIGEKYPDRTSEQQRIYDAKLAKIATDARRAGEDTKRAILDVSRRESVGLRNCAPQTVSATRAAVSDNRVPVGIQQSSIFSASNERTAEEAGKLAELRYLAREKEELNLVMKNPQKVMQGQTQQRQYDEEMLVARSANVAQLASLETFKQRYLQDEIERLSKELEKERSATFDIGEQQQRHYYQEIAETRRQHAGQMQALEDELNRALSS